MYGKMIPDGAFEWIFALALVGAIALGIAFLTVVIWLLSHIRFV